MGNRKRVILLALVAVLVLSVGFQSISAPKSMF